MINYLGQATYENVSNSKVKAALETNSESQAHWAKLGANFSTVEAYRRKKFEIPFDVALNAQRLITAKNTYNYTRFDLDFKMYF